MLESFWRPLLVEGGLFVDTRKAGPDSPILIRTMIQIDSDFVTFVDLQAGGDDPEVAARHSEAIRRACAPLFRTVKWVDWLTTGTAFVVSVAAPWRWFLHEDLPYGPLAGSAFGTLLLLARWAFPKPFFWVVKLVIKRSILKLIRN